MLPCRASSHRSGRLKAALPFQRMLRLKLRPAIRAGSSSVSTCRYRADHACFSNAGRAEMNGPRRYLVWPGKRASSSAQATHSPAAKVGRSAGSSACWSTQPKPHSTHHTCSASCMLCCQAGIPPGRATTHKSALHSTHLCSGLPGLTHCGPDIFHALAISLPGNISRSDAIFLAETLQSFCGGAICVECHLHSRHGLLLILRVKAHVLQQLPTWLVSITPPLVQCCLDI